MISYEPSLGHLFRQLKRFSQENRREREKTCWWERETKGVEWKLHNGVWRLTLDINLLDGHQSSLPTEFSLWLVQVPGVCAAAETGGLWGQCFYCLDGRDKLRFQALSFELQFLLNFLGRHYLINMFRYTIIVYNICVLYCMRTTRT